MPRPDAGLASKEFHHPHTQSDASVGPYSYTPTDTPISADTENEPHHFLQRHFTTNETLDILP